MLFMGDLERSLGPLRLASPMPYAYVIRRHTPYLLQFARRVWHIVWHAKRSVGLGKGSLGRTKGVHGGLG